MLALYRCFLHLYPREYRRCFGEEMSRVFDAARKSVAHNFRERSRFCVREIKGLLAGAAREHLRRELGCEIDLRRLEMRPEFHFPRSTIFLMLVLFAGVVLTIVKATSVELAYGETPGTVWPSLVSILVCMVLVMGAGAGIVWSILHALGRTGSQRIAKM